MRKLKPRKIAITLAAIGLMTCGALSGLNGTLGTNPMNSSGLVRAGQFAVKPAIGPRRRAKASVQRRFGSRSVGYQSGRYFLRFRLSSGGSQKQGFHAVGQSGGWCQRRQPVVRQCDRGIEGSVHLVAESRAVGRRCHAADVIQLNDGRFLMYYNAAKGDSPRSALGIAVADRVEGPYKDQGILLKSGMWGQPSEDGTIHDDNRHIRSGRQLVGRSLQGPDGRSAGL